MLHLTFLDLIYLPINLTRTKQLSDLYCDMLIFKHSLSVMCQVGKRVDKWLELLCARRVFPFGMGDENVANSKHGGMELLKHSVKSNGLNSESRF